jgi:hypothetical protein
MTPRVPPAPAVGLWLTAVAGATALLIGPLTPWTGPVEAVGLVVAVVAGLALMIWFVRQ